MSPSKQLSVHETYCRHRKKCVADLNSLTIYIVLCMKNTSYQSHTPLYSEKKKECCHHYIIGAWQTQHCTRTHGDNRVDDNMTYTSSSSYGFIIEICSKFHLVCDVNECLYFMEFIKKWFTWIKCVLQFCVCVCILIQRKNVGKWSTCTIYADKHIWHN